jgi:hypothetical protein
MNMPTSEDSEDENTAEGLDSAIRSEIEELDSYFINSATSR